MATRSQVTVLVRVVSVACGFVMAAGALIAWQVPDGWGNLGARFTLTANRSGPLGVTPTGTVLSIADLRPGESDASTHMEVRNQTGRTLKIRLRVAAASQDLDRLVHLEIRSDTHVIFDGPLRGLRTWTTTPASLASAHAATIAVHAWIPADARDGYQGRVVDAQLELAAQPTST